MNMHLSFLLRYMFEGGTNFGYWNGKVSDLVTYLKYIYIHSAGMRQAQCGIKGSDLFIALQVLIMTQGSARW